MTQPGTMPLEPVQIEQLRRGLGGIPSTDFGRRVVETFLFTGVHPRALGHPARWSMRVRADGQLEWRRPKNRKVVYVPLPPEIRPWLPQLIEELNARPIHPVNLNQLVHRTCSLFGMGWITPRGLRHTFGYMAYVRWRDVNLVADWLACDVSTALRYARAVTTAQKTEILSGGWR